MRGRATSGPIDLGGLPDGTLAPRGDGAVDRTRGTTAPRRGARPPPFGADGTVLPKRLALTADGGRTEEVSYSVLSLHLLQLALVYVNTLMIQEVLSAPSWSGRSPPRTSGASRR